ncbi:putative leucine-rich repeat-containing protein DDB_G0290503 isoform X4 [Aethina tumida]|uniref:putative leucine-rich repeat-containing protein DDB_G0290503 isoform X4 n=1 Tax=Aethina tumida TaxID=116153 RepID=UPI00096AFE2B|nr:putative leucine-rich repeat-containing protein DDB_G0290503 isoform X4 [Aethina tumida]
MKSIKAIFRRGQAPSSKIEDNRDDLSRTSSISNLNADAKGSRGAKPKKAASRDRLDKIGDKKHDKKGLTKNNNKLETNEYSPEAVNPTIDILQKQLAEMATEKSNLALQLGEQKGQLNILQKEIEKLKHSEEESNMQLDKLVEENTALRNRLRDVAHSPLSDNEKQQLLFESQRHHSSAPASIASNILDDMQGDVTACTTPEWDKHSSGNVSEISVACLQDKINQMQETHYSTNEELQATLQELTDLQRQLTELQQENERLTEEKTLMFDSLCRQTERLNDARSEVESLKQLLYKEKDEHAASNFESAVEREKKLVELLKSAQEEREGHLLKIEQLTGELQECRSLNEEREGDVVNLSERVKTLESTLDAKHAEHKQLDQELALAKDQCSSRQIEINRLKDLLDNARTKINELEQDRALSDKSELDELLDNARKEKDALESEVADLKEQVARSKNEAEKFKEQVSILQEECKVTRNNAKTTQSDLEYKCEKLQMEKASITEQLQHFQEVVNELQVQSQCQLEDKRQLSAVLSETQRNLSESEEKNLVLMAEVDELKKIRKEETEDWEKFQDDLLTSVRVANDFKTEAQKELQKFVLDNKSLRERVRQLESQIDKLKAGAVQSPAMFSMRRSSKKSSQSAEAKMGSTTSLDSADKKDFLGKFVKKREKKMRSKLKAMSVEEDMLIQSLNEWYTSIDPAIPEEELSEQEKVVRRLKNMYDQEQCVAKPVAKRPKELLAISKPLLDSVIANPKLKQITDDPSVPSVDSQIRASALENNVEVKLPRPKLKPTSVRRADSEQYKKPTKEESDAKTKSLSDIQFVFTSNENKLLRSKECENLFKEDGDTQLHRVSSIKPSDSVSNPRSSSHDVKLEEILDEIPTIYDYNSLPRQQQFAVKINKAFEEHKAKSTNLKRFKKNIQSCDISTPIKETVMKNGEPVNRLSLDFDNAPPLVSLNKVYSKSYDSLNVLDDDDDRSEGSSYSYGNFDLATGQIRRSQKRVNCSSNMSSINMQKNGFEFTEISPSDLEEDARVEMYDSSKDYGKYDTDKDDDDSLLMNSIPMTPKSYESKQEFVFKKPELDVDSGFEADKHGDDGQVFVSEQTIIITDQDVQEKDSEQSTDSDGDQNKDSLLVNTIPRAPKIDTNPESETIKKQNKYGVKAPLVIRNSYKQVLKEMKSRESFREAEEDKTDDDDDGDEGEVQETSFDDFFAPVRVDQPSQPNQNKLDEEDHKLLASIKRRDSVSSDINEADLLFVQGLSQKYGLENAPSETGSFERSSSIRRSKLKKFNLDEDIGYTPVFDRGYASPSNTWNKKKEDVADL